MPVPPIRDADLVFQEVYGQLRDIAVSIQRLDARQGVQATSLVHEAWLRMHKGVSFDSEEHFKSIAARAMRQVLRDRARRSRSLKRGGGWRRVTFTEFGAIEAVVDEIALSDALDELERLSPRQAEVVELRVLGGLANAEIGALLEKSERTVRRDWRVARAWLMARLTTAD